ncbi:DUF1648 domain-containing protein [Lentilactobacillus raoultii]|uniref:DUF1648 domain-containing protein n=1 Tax=Lentilactobacillus raoultii TaxID=1987503 RepID=A0ABW3PNH1_9LACO|nr:DUF1648 domain-containing protein [Lentilactobacillus raoultii]
MSRYSMIVSKIFYKFAGFHWVVTILSTMMILALYPKLPNQVPTHFGLTGADSFGNKAQVFILPVALVMLGVAVSSHLIDKQFPDLTILNTLSKSLLLAIMVVVWYAIVIALVTYYRLTGMSW